MSGLVLPRHVHESLKKKRDEATAASIKKSAVYRMDSDDFVTKKDIREQLAALEDYMVARRAEEPDYHLPKPSGWKLMVLMLTIPDESAGGVIIVDDAREARALSSPQGIVLDMGPAAYSDPERFLVDGLLTPWCGVGDRITFIKYDASLFQLANGQRLGFLNDTQPVSVVDHGWEVPQ